MDGAEHLAQSTANRSRIWRGRNQTTSCATSCHPRSVVFMRSRRPLQHPLRFQWGLARRWLFTTLRVSLSDRDHSVHLTEDRKSDMGSASSSPTNQRTPPANCLWVHLRCKRQNPSNKLSRCVDRRLENAKLRGVKAASSEGMSLGSVF